MVPIISFVNYQKASVHRKYTLVYFFVPQILKEMKSNEGLAPFLTEYSRIFELLYKARRTEKELSEKCTIFQV